VNSTTMDLFDKRPISMDTATSSWFESHAKYSGVAFDQSCMAKDIRPCVFLGISTISSMRDVWSIEQSIRDAVVTVCTSPTKRLIGDLGWTREQAHETRLRLRAFEEDWDAPGMEIYDEL